MHFFLNIIYKAAAWKIILTCQVDGEKDWSRCKLLSLIPKSSVRRKMPELGRAVVLAHVPVLNMVNTEHKCVPVCSLYTTLCALISFALLHHSPPVHADEEHSTIFECLCWTPGPLHIIRHFIRETGKEKKLPLKWGGLSNVLNTFKRKSANFFRIQILRVCQTGPCTHALCYEWNLHKDHGVMLRVELPHLCVSTRDKSFLTLHRVISYIRLYAYLPPKVSEQQGQLLSYSYSLVFIDICV